MRFFLKPPLLLALLFAGAAALMFSLDHSPVKSQAIPMTSGNALASSELQTQLETLQTERQTNATKMSSLEAEVQTLRKELSNRPQSATEPAQKQRARREGGAESASEAAEETPFAKSLLDIALKAGRLNVQLQQHPQQDIPELQYLDEGEWIHSAKGADLDSEAGVSKALADLRQSAKAAFAKLAVQALASFAQSNGGQAPLSIGQLVPYFAESPPPTVLDRYDLIPANSPIRPAPPNIGGPMILREKATVDSIYDTLFDIGPAGYASTAVGTGYRQKPLP